MKVVFGALIVLVALAAIVGLGVFVVFVYVWNINDIIANGANFWNIFWLLLVSVGVFGGVSNAK